MSGEDPNIRATRDKFEKRLRDHGVPPQEALREAINQARKADRKKR